MVKIKHEGSPGLRAYFNDLKRYDVLPEEEQARLAIIIAEHSPEILELEDQIDHLNNQIAKQINYEILDQLEQTKKFAKKRIMELWAIIGPAFQEITARNQKLVAKYAIKLKGSSPLEDAICSGNDGLRKAILMFRPERGNKLSTYAIWWICQAIKREKQLDKVVHVPVNLSEKYTSASHHEANWRNLTGEDPTDAELAALIITDKTQKEEARKIYLSKHPGIANHGGINRNKEYLEIKATLKRVQQETRNALAIKQLVEAGHKSPTKKQIQTKITDNFIASIRALAKELEAAPPTKRKSGKKSKSSKIKLEGKEADKDIDIDQNGITPATVKDLRDIKSSSIVINGESVDESGEIKYSHIDGSAAAREKTPNPEQMLELVEIQDIVRKSLRFLTFFERKVIKARFGLEESDEKTLQEIGDEADLTKERIRQIEATALKKLREHISSDLKAYSSI